MRGLTYTDGYFPFLIPRVESDPTIDPGSPEAGVAYPKWVEVPFEWIVAYYWRVCEFSSVEVDVNLTGSATIGDYPGYSSPAEMVASGTVETVALTRGTSFNDIKPGGVGYVTPIIGASDHLLLASIGSSGVGLNYRTSPALTTAETGYAPEGTITSFSWDDEASIFFNGTVAMPSVCYFQFAEFEGQYYALMEGYYTAGYGYLVRMYGELGSEVSVTGAVTTSRVLEEFEGVEVWADLGGGDFYYYTSKTTVSLEIGTFTFRIAGFDDVVFPLYINAGMYAVNGDLNDDSPQALGATFSGNVDVVLEGTKYMTYGGIYDEETGEKV